MVFVTEPMKLILLAIAEMEKKYQLRCANVFHAGDGNLHPLILFDANDPDQMHRCELFGADIVQYFPEGMRGVGLVDLMQFAIAWGYKNSVIIKRKFENNIEFISGETLMPTNLEKMYLSHSKDFAWIPSLR